VNKAQQTGSDAHLLHTVANQLARHRFKNCISWYFVTHKGRDLIKIADLHDKPAHDLS
jgi:hypothetical protein